MPVFFEIQTVENVDFCEIKDELKYVYYTITNIYIITIVCIPIAIIMASNILIIIKAKQAAKQRTTRTQAPVKQKRSKAEPYHTVPITPPPINNKSSTENNQQKTKNSSMPGGLKSHFSTGSFTNAADLISVSNYGLEIQRML